MITENFLHFKGIGPKTSETIKNAGFKTWQDIIDNPSNLPCSANLRNHLFSQATGSLNAYKNNDIQKLLSAFSTSEQWRILNHYHDRISYFDIETSGLSRYDAKITVIACLHKGEMHTFFRDDNLADFLDLLDDVTLLSSFNGNCFDIPFVLESYHIPELECPHIDLRWICYHAGLRGPLKVIEKECGVKRNDDIGDIDGFEAVNLWHRWVLHKDRKAKDLLVKYCEADVYALRDVAGKVLDLKRS